MKKLKWILSAIILIIVILGGSIFFSNFKIVPHREIHSNGVLEQIKEISELNTVEMYFNEIVDFKDAKKLKGWTIPFTTKSFIFTAKARVKAGVDLSLLTESAIKIDKKQITITLPSPTITSKEILETKSYYEKDGLFNEITNDDTLEVLGTFEQQLEQQAIESGILSQAEEHAKLVVQNLLLWMDFEDITIQFQKP